MEDEKPYEKMDKHERRWQVESDVEALVRAARVRADPARHRRATAHAASLVESKRREATAMAQVARQGKK